MTSNSSNEKSAATETRGERDMAQGVAGISPRREMRRVLAPEGRALAIVLQTPARAAFLEAVRVEVEPTIRRYRDSDVVTFPMFAHIAVATASLLLWMSRPTSRSSRLYVPAMGFAMQEPVLERLNRLLAAISLYEVCGFGTITYFPPRSSAVIHGMAMKFPIMPPMLDSRKTRRMCVTRFV